MITAKGIARYLIVLIIITATVCGIAIGAGVYSNGFESVRTRYLLADGAVIKKNGTVKLAESDISFKLTGAGFKAVDWGDYTVTITANPQACVKYEVDGEAYELEATDLTQAFAIEKQSDGFTLSVGSYALESVLKIVYGADVHITDYVKGVAPYKVTVTAENGKKAEFYLNYGETPPDNVKLDPWQIIFGG